MIIKIQRPEMKVSRKARLRNVEKKVGKPK
jgi:hypothetical protein